MSAPTLKPNSSWFTPAVSTIKRNTITLINFVDSYVPTVTITDSWDASVAQDGGIMCYVVGTVLTIAGNGSGSILANEDSSYMFSDVGKKDYFRAVTAINGLDILDTSNATVMNHMFNNCNALVDLNVTGFNTSNCTTFRAMFQKTSIMEINVIKWNTSLCEDMSFMFNGCKALAGVDISSWDTSKVKGMKAMFQDCSVLNNLSVKNLDVLKVTTFIFKWITTFTFENMNAMFRSTNLKYVDVAVWNTSNDIAFA